MYGLYTDLLQALKGERLSSVFSPDGTLISASAAPHCGVGQQCSEIEENLRKNNSKRAYQLVKDLTTVKQGKATTVQDRSGKCLTEEREILNRWTEYYTITRPMEIHQYWTDPDRHKG